MDAIAIVIAIAVIVEAVVQVIKAGVPETVPSWVWPVCSVALGVLLCVLSGVDALALLGVSLSIPWVGCVLTGVLVSRGASFVHDIWDRVNGEMEITVPIEVPIEVPVDVHIDGYEVVEKPPDGAA